MNERIEIKSPRKLIESSLPLDVINIACAREKSIHHGHPSNLHLWWARRPLAAARAVIFAQMVNDPGWKQALEGRAPTPAEKSANTKKRNELFRLIEQLVQWENTNNKELFERAHKEILRSWEETCELNKDHPHASELFDPTKLPAFHDPFAGGGALPLEAQRLGLESYASDLNPVAVLINKAMIEIPSKFANMPPVNPEYQKNKEKKQLQKWHGAQGIAEDVRYYGKWLEDQAKDRVGELYPRIEINKQAAIEQPNLQSLVGQTLNVIAWIWVRTVKSPNPAFSNVDIPLASTFILSTKKGKEAYVEPVIKSGSYHFKIKTGIPHNLEAVKKGTKLGRANFSCIMSGVPVTGSYIKSEAIAGRMGARLMAIVGEGKGGRVFVSPTPEHEEIIGKASPSWKPETLISGSTQYLGVKPYGMNRFDQLFTNRQLATLTTLFDLVSDAYDKVLQDMQIYSDNFPLSQNYAQAVALMLALSLNKVTARGSTACGWDNGYQKISNVFGRQAIPMVWDYAESNPFSGSTGSIEGAIASTATIIELLPLKPGGKVSQADATLQTISAEKVISTDPPYYDNVPYADLSDYFYVWLHRSLRNIMPESFKTLAAPKTGELVAFAHRHADKAEAEKFFLDGMTQAMSRLSGQANSCFPTTIYYAFKQSQSDDEVAGKVNTGWSTFLEAVVRAGFVVTGTWPMRTEYTSQLKTKRNALSSSIVLVCRKRNAIESKSITRREFEERLKREMPEHFDVMIAGNDGRSPVGPVDLQQAALGPGMGIFSSYKEVLKADGAPMTVKEALLMINKELDTYLNSFGDPQTNFSLVWFEQHGWENGPYGDADVLARAKGITVQDAENAGILVSRSSQVRLLRPNEYDKKWSVETDSKLPQWEALHRVALAYARGGQSAGELLAQLAEHGMNSEDLRQLAYRLYVFCERMGWAEDAGVYSTLMEAWGDISMHASNAASPVPQTEALF